MFDYKLSAGVSKLAWCAVVSDQETVQVYHGSAIETHKKGFVEGAWDGKFEALDFDQANFFIGSGALINDAGELIFVAPSHTLERLYTLREKEHLYVSNSLPLLLTLSNNQLLPDYLYYERDLSTILYGLQDYTKQIPLSHNREFSMYYYCNLKIDQLDVIQLPKQPLLPFTDFSDYETRLSQTLQTIKDNANSPLRQSTYGIITTISSGYDAACCAAIVKKIGCDTAVTFNAPESYATDSGEAIAEQLGYTQVISKNAYEYLMNDDLLEAEFVSSGELGTGIVFTAFEEEFKDNIIVLGERGDYIWGKHETSNNDFRFEQNIFPATSIIEHRLRIGYMILPLPLYGAAQWESIRAITLSKEMAPYTIGGYYCRPIARKFLEDAGVPRDAFGVKKLGVGINYRFDNLSRLKQRMSPQSYNHFLNFYQEHKRPISKNIPNWGRFLWGTRVAYSSYFIRKLLPWIEPKYSDTLVPNPGPPSYLIQWGVSTMLERLQHLSETT